MRLERLDHLTTNRTGALRGTDNCNSPWIEKLSQSVDSAMVPLAWGRNSRPEFDHYRTRRPATLGAAIKASGAWQRVDTWSSIPDREHASQSRVRMDRAQV